MGESGEGYDLSGDDLDCDLGKYISRHWRMRPAMWSEGLQSYVKRGEAQLLEGGAHKAVVEWLVWAGGERWSMRAKR